MEYGRAFPRFRPGLTPPFRGYVLDRYPEWVIALNVKKHDRKIPMPPGIRRSCVADLRATFQSEDVSKIVGGRYRFSFTWPTSGKTDSEQIQDSRALREAGKKADSSNSESKQESSNQKDKSKSSVPAKDR